MRLLFLSVDCPLPANNGLRMRTWSLLRALAECGHEIALFSFSEHECESGIEAELRRVCRSVRLFPIRTRSLSARRDLPGRLRAAGQGMPYAVARFACSALQAQVMTALQVGRFDAIVADTVFSAINLPVPRPVPVVVNTHNLEHCILRRFAQHAWRPSHRAYAAWEWRRLRDWERRIWQQADLVLACSEHDRSSILRLAPQAACAVVPNVVEVESYPTHLPEEAHTLLYTGGLDWYPNRDAVLYCARRILPRIRRGIPDARLIVAGRNGSMEFQHRLRRFPGVECLGAVADMRQVIGRASVCVVPLRIGSGTRLKILEAAAMAKPIVATPLGAEGLDFTDCWDLLLAAHPDEFAENVAYLLGSPLLRGALGRAARRTVEQSYTQAAAVHAVQEAWAQVWPGKARAGRAHVA